jgi:hypothetical protein
MQGGRKRRGKKSGKGDHKPVARKSRKLQTDAQDSEYRSLLERVESRSDAAEVKKIAARIERENPE